MQRYLAFQTRAIQSIENLTRCYVTDACARTFIVNIYGGM